MSVTQLLILTVRLERLIVGIDHRKRHKTRWPPKVCWLWDPNNSKRNSGIRGPGSVRSTNLFEQPFSAWELGPNRNTFMFYVLIIGPFFLLLIFLFQFLYRVKVVGASKLSHGTLYLSREIEERGSRFPKIAWQVILKIVTVYLKESFILIIIIILFFLRKKFPRPTTQIK
jgi:hypothetical protein